MKIKKVNFGAASVGIVIIAGAVFFSAAFLPKGTEREVKPDNEINTICLEETSGDSNIGSAELTEYGQIASEKKAPENMTAVNTENVETISLSVSSGVSMKDTGKDKFYTGGAGGDRFFYYTLKNQTDKKITEYEYCMLAYDNRGNPLKVYWNPADSGELSSYESAVKIYDAGILPGSDYTGEQLLFDADSTWSFMELGVGEDYRVDMVLYCLRKVVFEDGTVWDNPDYENWLDNCRGKKIPADYLWEYYPCEYTIDIENIDKNGQGSF